MNKRVIVTLLISVLILSLVSVSYAGIFDRFFSGHRGNVCESDLDCRFGQYCRIPRGSATGTCMTRVSIPSGSSGRDLSLDILACRQIDVPMKIHDFFSLIDEFGRVYSITVKDITFSERYGIVAEIRVKRGTINQIENVQENTFLIYNHADRDRDVKVRVERITDGMNILKDMAMVSAEVAFACDPF